MCVPPLVPTRKPLEEESNPSASAREGEAELTRSPVGWFVLVLLGFLPTVGGTNPVRFESDSILGMRIQSHWLPTTGHYLAYQRDTYTNVTGRDLQLEAGRTTSLFKTMTETLDLARTNIASGVKEDDLKPIQRPAKRTVVRRTSPRRTCTTRP